MSEREGFTGVQVRSYYGANWFTDRGVREKRRLIEQKGLPNLKRCLFVTLTIPEGVCSPRKAYETGKERLRRFLGAFRKAIGREFAWAWKLEFQENGYPHWHVILDYRQHIPPEFLYLFEKWWGLGRVNVERLKYETFSYLFKYVSKSVAGDVDPETGIPLPDWVLDYRKTLKDGRVSAGIRFWQTGGGFYTQEPEPVEQVAKDPEPQRTCRVQYTIRQRWSMWMRKATIFIKNAEGRYTFSRQVYFKQPFCEVISQVVQALLNGKATAVPGCNGWSCRLSTIKELLCQTNQMDLSAACLSSRGMVYFSAD